MLERSEKVMLFSQEFLQKRKVLSRAVNRALSIEVKIVCYETADETESLKKLNLVIDVTQINII